MYNSILEGLFAKNNITNTEDKKTYLLSLQESVREIREAYRNFPVRFNYNSPNIQAAYLLAYIPHYTDLLLKVLNSSGASIAKEKITKLAFFGSGPCPEIIGYLRYLEEHNSTNLKELEITIWDIAVNDWKWSRDIVFKYIAPTYLKSNHKRNVGTVDISTPFEIDASNEKQIVVFQNCLNEISENAHSHLINNIIDIFDNLASGSYLALIDLDYWQVRDLIETLEIKIGLKNNVVLLRSVNEGEIEHRTTQNNEPKIVLDYLLIDKFGETGTGLLPRRKIKFIYSLLRKK